MMPEEEEGGNLVACGSKQTTTHLVACGSNQTTLRPLTNWGTSVRWYTELNPIPNRPVLLPLDVAFFKESPMRWIEAKSASWNRALLYAKMLGPCRRGRGQSFRPG